MKWMLVKERSAGVNQDNHISGEVDSVQKGFVRMQTILRTLGVLLQFVCAAGTFAQDHPTSVEAIGQQIADSQDPWELNELYHRLFVAAGTDGLAGLMRSPVDSIAIQAAWEEVALTVPEEKGPDIYRPDKDKLNRFLGFLEGRGRVIPPEWWAEGILDARAHVRHNIFPGDSRVAGVDWKLAPDETTLKASQGGRVLSRGADSISLPDDFFEGVSRLNRPAACFTPTHCFVAAYDEWGYPFPVKCLDRNTGKVVWSSSACGCWIGIGLGISDSFATVSVQNDVVVVFGFASIGMYAHAFRVSDGATVFAFFNRI